MRILTVGFKNDFAKELEKEIEKYFICIVSVLLTMQRISMTRPTLLILGTMS